MATGEPLHVIALVSGGKDSFFSVLHCLANGHRVVALANLHPPDATTTTPVTPVLSGELGAAQGSSYAWGPGTCDGDVGDDDEEEEQEEQEEQEESDFNSFMYQTVGHQVISLYAAATGLPLFRQPIVGTAIHHGISYRNPREGSEETRTGEEDEDNDETESLVPLLRAVVKAHPEANALCTGAILSTYQRTRVESVALRLGLVPLAYLWQFPVLPISSYPAHGLLDDRGNNTDAQLLRDMASVGLEARIVKVASAGLDEDFLWDNVASEGTIKRMERALRKFGGGGRGSVLGEGGEFETLVVDGPAALFKGRIVVRDDAKRLVREGGGSSWLSIREATVEMKTASSQDEYLGNLVGTRVPGLLETRFETVFEALSQAYQLGHHNSISNVDMPPSVVPLPSGLLSRLKESSPSSIDLPRQQQWCFIGNSKQASIKVQTTQVVDDIRQQLYAQSLPANAIAGTVIILRHMSDFPTINKLYGTLFPEPNPPARVTISCGDCLPQGSGIAVYLTLQPGLTSTPEQRQGLHVQSRSYWAPANIGPYSQAISIPALPSSRITTTSSTDTICFVVTIAGQIPLIPASMALPASSPSSTTLEVTLALQHLWRIGVEMRVQWWTSAVAYFPQTPDTPLMKQRALLASRAWNEAHLWSSQKTGEDEDGPDLWDRKYNPQYMSLSGGADDAAAINPSLPDWDTLHGLDMDDVLEVAERRRHFPFVFAAEVDELPRSAGVEWHAHSGLAKVSTGSIRTASSRSRLVDSSNMFLELYHVILESNDGVFIHSAAAISPSDAGLDSSVSYDDAVQIIGKEVSRSLHILTGQSSPVDWKTIRPYLSYMDYSRVSYTTAMTVNADLGGKNRISHAIIPCRSLWNSRGERLSFVLLWEIRLSWSQ